MQELKLEANPSGHFVVQKITANELIGSFFVSPAFKGQLSNPIGDQSIAELLVNSSGGELSFEENSQEAMAALILN